jgi:hypothetical protein
VYTDQQIAAVYLWAALHDRPVSWACQRRHWPVQAWRRALPDQSTMSRRMRHPAIADLLRTLLKDLQRTFGWGEVLVADGKPLELGEYTRDPDAATGRGAGRYARGYKIHVILDVQTNAVIAYETHPLNVSETTTAAEMMGQETTCIPDGSLLLGDKLFDSNVLHEAAQQRKCQLIAPRKRPGASLGHRRHHPNRRESIQFTEGADRTIWQEVLSPQRDQIERFFGMLVSSSCGLIGLPAWVRRLHRVRSWVGAKLAINAARIAAKKALAA